MTVTHGTLSTYMNHRCRCKRCRGANTVYRRARVKMLRSRHLCIDCAEPSPDGTHRCQACRDRTNEARQRQARARTRADGVVRRRMAKIGTTV